MSARSLYLILTAALFLAVSILGVAAGFLLLAPVTGIPLTLSLPVAAIGSSGALALDTPAYLASATVNLDRGEIEAIIQGPIPFLIQLANLLVTGGIVIGVLLLLRRFARDVVAATPFTTGSAVRLRWIGVLLVALPLWKFLIDVLWHYLLQGITLSTGGRLVPFFSFEKMQAGELRLLASFDFEFVFAGLLMLAVAEAFRIGIRLRQDSEAIV